MKQQKQKRNNIRIAWRVLVALFAVALVVAMIILISHSSVFTPEGSISHDQKRLMLFTVGLGMIVVIPVFVMLFWFAWRYREGNEKAVYKPNESGSRFLETLWWGIPIVIILVLSVVTWVSSHELDPYKTVDSDNKPIRVQVVAMEWRWLFLYPELGVASLNEVRFPEKTPVNFELTADAPMSAFWIPKLGSQTYAMSAMSSHLSLQADHPGTYRGFNTNINGTGYAKMTFGAVALSNADFQSWVYEARQGDQLNKPMYDSLAKQSTDKTIQYYGLADAQLYNQVRGKYMSHSGSSRMEGMKQ